MTNIQSLLWIAAGLVLASEAFVASRKVSRKQVWEDVPVLSLRQSDLHSPALEERLPEKADGSDLGSFEFHETPERLKGAIEQLQFSYALSGVFLPQEGGSPASPAMDLFYLEYEAGNPRFVYDVFGHAPEVCMRATGAELKKAHPARNVVVESKAMVVRVLEFHSPITNAPLWIFKLTWVPEESPIQPGDTASTLRREKVLSGLFRDSQPPARVILAGGRNFESLNEAWKAFDSLVAERLRFTHPVTTGSDSSVTHFPGRE